MAVTSRLQGLNTGLAIKAPVLVASTGNLTLSATQVVDGIAVSSCDRVLVKDQTTVKENGVYQVETAAWTRTKDWDGSLDVVRGTVVFVSTGTATGGRWYGVSSTGNNIPGTNNITFAEVSFPASLTAALNTNGFAINESEGSAVVASTETSIWSPIGNTLHVTASTVASILSLSSAPRIGAQRWVIFDSTGVLSHDGSTLILPSSADISFLAGDVAMFYGDSTAQVRMMGFLPADGRDSAARETVSSGGAFMRNSGLTVISSDSTSGMAALQLRRPVDGSLKTIVCQASATALTIETTLAAHVFLTGVLGTVSGSSILTLADENLFGASITLRGLNSSGAGSSVAWAVTRSDPAIVSTDVAGPETLTAGSFARNHGLTLFSSDSTSDTATALSLRAPVTGIHKEIVLLTSASALVIETTLAAHKFLTGSTLAAGVGTSALLLNADNLFGTAITLRGVSSTQWALTSQQTAVVVSS